jgi:ubiquinone/menaquinone biosynthesis C-methylase UbiE
MDSSFDQLAFNYDREFVHSPIGRSQRYRVWSFLERQFRDVQTLEILELGCGTGEDALWMASMGHNVMATDSSQKMIEVAANKAKKSDNKANVSFTILDLEDLNAYPEDRSFDMVFSNFGGLNCVSPGSLGTIMDQAYEMLNPGGRFVMVLMSQFCLWEWFYFRMKGNKQASVRRKGGGPLDVNLGESAVKTWFYSPAGIKVLAGERYHVRKIRPVGSFIPPSYLNNYFRNKTRLLGLLGNLEKLSGGIGKLADLSDHFLVELEVQK